MLEYLKTNSIAVLDWHTRSPDLNIIENMWHLMEEVVYSNKQYNEPKWTIMCSGKMWKEVQLGNKNESIQNNSWTFAKGR